MIAVFFTAFIWRAVEMLMVKKVWPGMPGFWSMIIATTITSVVMGSVCWAAMKLSSRK